MTHDERSPVPPTPVLEIADPRTRWLVHPGWADDLPWLVQGTTTRGHAAEPFDLGLFSDGSPEGTVTENWNAILIETGMARVVHARQVHGSAVRTHGSGPDGLEFVEVCDAHVTDEPGVLLAVATADCVPVFVADAATRRVAMVHAGWRGTAAGVLEAALGELAPRTVRADIHLHLGPAICGRCYEVGAEVFEALDQEVPARPTPIDLRAVLAVRAVRAGVPPGRVTVSRHCTRCTGSGLFSHRAGDRERQVGFLGVRP